MPNGYGATLGPMHRRLLLQSLAAAPLAAVPTAAAPKIVVTDLEIFQVKVNHRGNWVLPRLRTNAGITGIGDASHGKDDVVLTLLRRFFERIKGRSIFDIEWLRGQAEVEVKETGIPAAIALSGIEQ